MKNIYSSILLLIISVTASNAQTRVVEVWDKHPFFPLYKNSCYAYDIVFDFHGNLWVATQAPDAGAWYYDGVNWIKYEAKEHHHEEGEDEHENFEGLSANHTSCIEIDKWGAIWFGSTGHGVSKLADTTWSYYSTSKGLGHGVVTDILAIEDTVWIATWGGLTKIVNDTIHQTYQAEVLPAVRITSLAVDLSKNLWIGTEKGISKYDGTSFTTYIPVSGNLTNNYIESFAVDKNGNVWAAIYQSGLWMFNGTSWVKQYEDQTDFCAMAVDKKGHLWAGSSTSGVWRYNGSSWTQYTTNDSLLHNKVSSIAVDNKGAVWIGSIGGLTKVYDSTIVENTTISNHTQQNQDIRIYPNPATSIVNIENVLHADIQLINSTGQVLMQCYGHDETIQIPVSIYSSGLYFLRILRDNDIFVRKVLISEKN